MKPQQIPNRLRLYREKAGLRQIDIAHMLGQVSSERISRWEKGKAFPSIMNLFKLATVYRILPHELYADAFSTIKNQVRFSLLPSQEQSSVS